MSAETTWDDQCLMEKGAWSDTCIEFFFAVLHRHSDLGALRLARADRSATIALARCTCWLVHCFAGGNECGEHFLFQRLMFRRLRFQLRHRRLRINVYQFRHNLTFYRLSFSEMWSEVDCWSLTSVINHHWGGFGSQFILREISLLEWTRSSRRRSAMQQCHSGNGKGWNLSFVRACWLYWSWQGVGAQPDSVFRALSVDNAVFIRLACCR